MEIRGEPRCYSSDPLTVHTGGFKFETQGEFDVVDITRRVERVVAESGVRAGIALVYAGHATGVIVLNEHEAALLEDLRDFLRGLAPSDGDYHHHGNAHAHLRSMLLEPSKVVPVVGGRLGLGTWQSLYWVEVETRPRRRRVDVTVLGE
jgi:secondary thiamine-phosphate synthase enzyme